MVNQVGGYGEMGIYNAVVRIKIIPDAVLVMLVAPIIPILSDSFGRSDQNTYRKTLRYYLLVSTIIIVPVSLVQTAAPVLTLLPYGPQYQSHHAIVIWLMLHSVLSSFCASVGYIFVTMGRMWLVWFLGFSFAVCYSGLSYWLVPKYGADGYAASMAIAYGVSSVPGVVLLYYKFPEIMREMRWGITAVLSLGLFLTCLLADYWIPFAY